MNVEYEKEGENEEKLEKFEGEQITSTCPTGIFSLTQPPQSVADMYLKSQARGPKEREAKVKRFLDLKYSSSPQHFNDHLFKSKEFHHPLHLDHQVKHAGIKPHQMSESLQRDFYMAPLEGFIDEICMPNVKAVR